MTAAVVAATVMTPFVAIPACPVTAIAIAASAVVMTAIAAAVFASQNGANCNTCYDAGNNAAITPMSFSVTDLCEGKTQREKERCRADENLFGE